MKNKVLKNTLIILILFLSVSAVIIPKEINNLDELWNYNFARNIADGLLPYKDFNMVITPLLSMICGAVLKFTFNELIVMRILAVCLITAILYITYKIFRILKINQYICNILIIGIYLLLYKHFCIDYNFAALLVILMTIYYELKNISKKEDLLNINKRDVFLGILVGSSILLKQTIGLFTSVIFIFYKLLIVTKKEEVKKVFKIIFLRLFGVIIPVIVFVIYLIINNIWYDFLDYTVYSLNTFSNKISYLNLLKGNYGSIIGILSVLAPLTIIVMYVVSVCKKIKTEEQKNIFILFAYSVASFIVVYPISDSIHFLIGSFPTLIALGYLIYMIIDKIIEKNLNQKFIYGIRYFIKSVSIISVSVITFYAILNLFQYINTCGKYDKLMHFKYMPISNEKRDTRNWRFYIGTK